jgi:hypothetical protein
MEDSNYSDNIRKYFKKGSKKYKFFYQTLWSKVWERQAVGTRPQFQAIWGTPEDMQLPYDDWEALMLVRIRELHGIWLDDGTLEGW